MPKIVVIKEHDFLRPIEIEIFCQILFMAFADRLTMLNISMTRPCKIMKSAVSSATSVPPPIAIPIRGGKGGRIVDAIADLGDDLALILQFGDNALLVFGHHLGMDFCDPHAFADDAPFADCHLSASRS